MQIPKHMEKVTLIIDREKGVIECKDEHGVIVVRIDGLPTTIPPMEMQQNLKITAGSTSKFNWKGDLGHKITGTKTISFPNEAQALEGLKILERLQHENMTLKGKSIVFRTRIQTVKANDDISIFLGRIQ